MPSIYLQPENKYFLSSLRPSPLLETVEIIEIGIDPDLRVWTFHLSGAARGDKHLWEELANRIQDAVPEVSKVLFRWEEESDENYLENAIKQVNIIPVGYGTPTNGNSSGNGNGNGEGRRGGRGSRRLVQDSIRGEATPIVNLQEEERNVVVCGEVVSFDSRLTRTGKTLVMFDLYDGTDTLGCKVFLDEPQELPIKKGKWLKVRGNLQFQSFDNQLSLMVQGLTPVDEPPRLADQAPKKRVELHLHTKMSGLDGTIDVEHVIQLAYSGFPRCPSCR